MQKPLGVGASKRQRLARLVASSGATRSLTKQSSKVAASLAARGSAKVIKVVLATSKVRSDAAKSPTADTRLAGGLVINRRTQLLDRLNTLQGSASSPR